MADKKIIAATLSVDTGNSVKNVNEVKTSLKEVQTVMKETATEAKEVGKNVEASSGSFGNLKEKMTGLPGPLGQAGEGVNKLGTAFKALLANPVALVITAIVGALALLYKAFTNTFEGAQKVEQVFAGVKAAGQALLDNITKVGSAIYKALTFDFSGAIDEIKGVAKAADEAYNKMAKLTAEAQKLAVEQQQNDLDAVDRQAKIADLKEKIASGELTPAEKKKQAEELYKLAEQNAKEDLDLASRTAKNKIDQLTLEQDGERKNSEEITQIKIKQRQGEIENANELRRIGKIITGAEKEEQAARKEAATKAEADRKARAAQSLADRKAEAQKLKEFQSKLTGLEQENILAQIKDGYERELKALELKFTNEIKAIEDGVKSKNLTKEQAFQLERQLDEKLYLQALAIEEKRDADKKAKEDAATAKAQELENKRIENAKKGLAGTQNSSFQNKVAGAESVINDPMAEFQAKQDALNMEVDAYKTALDQKLITEKEYNEKMAGLAQARREIRDNERLHTQQIVSSIGDAFETLSALAGKQTAAGKALAIASTTIKTFQSAVAAFQGMVTSIPGPVGIALGAVAAAGAIASGIATVKKIVAVQVPGGGGGGSVPTGVPMPSAPIAPQQTQTTLDANSINKIGNATSRVFVLDSDVANSRDRTERLNRAARLGGVLIFMLFSQLLYQIAN